MFPQQGWEGLLETNEEGALTNQLVSFSETPGWALRPKPAFHGASFPSTLHGQNNISTLGFLHGVIENKAAIVLCDIVFVNQNNSLTPHPSFQSCIDLGKKRGG